MALGIKGLPAADTAEVYSGMLFEGVAANVDESGKLYARKVRAEQLARYMAGETEELGITPVTEMTDGRITTAVAAHNAAAGAHSAAVAAHNAAAGAHSAAVAAHDTDEGAHSDIRLAVLDEADRALAAELLLEEGLMGKAGKLTAGAKRLADAETGDQIGWVHFRTEQTPASLGVDGELTLADGKFELTGGVFKYTRNGQQPVIIYNGAWQRAGIDAGGAGVIGEVNAEGGIWALSLFGLADLSDVRDELLAKHGEQETRLTSHETLINGAVAKNTEQDGRLTALEDGLLAETGTGRDQAISDALTAHGTDPAAHDGRLTALEDGFALIPAIPASDGEYKLVVSGGAVSWEAV